MFNPRVTLSRALSVIVGVLAVQASASAATIMGGAYALHNHPDGASNPPPYGMRLDELYNVSGDNDIFTFDFDAPGADMKLVYDGASIHIFGTAVGGRDTGGGHAADNYLGIYTIDFTYNVGVQSLEPADDDIAVIPPASPANFGTLVPNNPAHPSFNVAVNLEDVLMGVSLRLGDEDNDAGHRGYNGISGWGWLAVDGIPHVGVHDDFLFTAVLIPEPATAALGLLGLALVMRRRARRAA